MGRREAIALGITLALFVAAIGIVVTRSSSPPSPLDRDEDLAGLQARHRDELAERDDTIRSLREELERARLALEEAERRPDGTSDPDVHPQEDGSTTEPEAPARRRAAGELLPGADAAAWLRSRLPDRYGDLDADAIRHLRELSLDGIGEITDDDLAFLAELESLTSLDLSGHPITDAGLGHLAGMSSLDHLDLSGTEVTGDGIVQLRYLDVESLHLSDTALDDRGLELMPTLDSLESLKLNRADIGDLSVDAIAGHPNLRHLEIDGTDFTAQGLAELLARNPSLQRIEARGTSISMDDLREVLTRFPDCEVVLEQGGPGIRLGHLRPTR